MYEATAVPTGWASDVYLIEKDDNDTWEAFCDIVRATMVEGEKLKGIAEVEIE